MSHKVECGYCHKTREQVHPDEMLIESPDKKTYICTPCLAQCQAAVAATLRARGHKLQLVKDPL